MRVKAFTLVESLTALVITGFLLLMVTATATKIQKHQVRILQHQQALLALASEADTIRASHRHMLQDGMQRTFYTVQDLPPGLVFPASTVRVHERGEENCFSVHLQLSWGKEKRLREQLSFVVCR